MPCFCVSQSFCCCFFRQAISWQVDVSVCLAFCHWLFRSGSSSCSTCNRWNLSARFSLYFSLVCGSFRRPKLYFCLFVAVPTQFFFNLSFSLAISTWSSDVTSTPSPFHSHIFKWPPKSLSYANVIYLVLCQVIRWHPCVLVYHSVCKNAAPRRQCFSVCRSLSNLIHLPYTLSISTSLHLISYTDLFIFLLMQFSHFSCGILVYLRTQPLCTRNSNLIGLFWWQKN